MTNDWPCIVTPCGGAAPCGTPVRVWLSGRRRRDHSLGGKPRPEQLLTEVGALAAVGLRLAEQVRGLLVAVPLRVLNVGLQPQRVVQAGLGVPDEVVILVLGPGDVPGFGLGHRGVLLSA